MHASLFLVRSKRGAMILCDSNHVKNLMSSWWNYTTFVLWERPFPFVMLWCKNQSGFRIQAFLCYYKCISDPWKYPRWTATFFSSELLICLKYIVSFKFEFSSNQSWFQYNWDWDIFKRKHVILTKDFLTFSNYFWDENTRP